MKPTPLDIPPGIQRDGTLLTKATWTDGQWVRFYDGRPKKIGGFTATNGSLNGISRALDVDWRGTTGFLHSFTPNGIDQTTIDANGVINPILTARTPAGFTADVNNTWSVDKLTDQASNKVVLVAHATNNLLDIGSGASRPVYVGNTDAATPLTAAGVSVDGGIVVAQPYVMAFGSDGIINWSAPNQPSNWGSGGAGTARITSSKLVAGRSIRTGQSGTGALLWSLDNLILARFIGGAPVWDFSIVARDVSILSSQSPVEYDGMYYWPGVDTFYQFDGSQVRTLENTMNKRYFFKGLNFSRRMAVWGMKLPEFEEIIWYYPRGSAQECTHYVVFCVGESRRTGRLVWYDGELGRSAGFPAKVFRYPLKTGTSAPFTLFQHELGVDANGAPQNSFIESNTLSLVPGGVDQWLYCNRVELDMEQNQNMTVTVTGRKYPRGADTAEVFTIGPTAETLDLKEQRRYMRLRFSSNVLGGDFEIGKPLLHLGPEDSQQKA